MGVVNDNKQNEGSKMNASTKAPAALPYPISINMTVFRDDGQWGNYRAWFLRPVQQLERLAVAKITLGHFEGSDEPAYTAEQWRRKSDQLVVQYPGCVFVY